MKSYEIYMGVKSSPLIHTANIRYIFVDAGWCRTTTALQCGSVSICSYLLYSALHPRTQDLLWHFGVATDRASSPEIFGTDRGGGITLSTGRGGGLRGTGFRGAGHSHSLTVVFPVAFETLAVDHSQPSLTVAILSSPSGGLRITGRGGQIPTFTPTDCGLSGLIIRGKGFFSGCSGCSTFTIDCFLDASFADGRGGSGRDEDDCAITFCFTCSTSTFTIDCFLDASFADGCGGSGRDEDDCAITFCFRRSTCTFTIDCFLDASFADGRDVDLVVMKMIVPSPSASRVPEMAHQLPPPWHTHIHRQMLQCGRHDASASHETSVSSRGASELSTHPSESSTSASESSMSEICDASETSSLHWHTSVSLGDTTCGTCACHAIYAA